MTATRWSCIALVLAASACGKSSDSSGDTDTSTPPAPPSGETGDTQTGSTTPTGDACPYTGSWELSVLRCDGVDVTSAFVEAVHTTTMLVTDSPSGNCFVEVILEGEYCEEREEYEAQLARGDTWGVTAFGVTSCDPLACTFDKGDAECAIGDRSGSWTEGVTYTSSLLVIERSDNLAFCNGFGATATVVEFTGT